MTEKRAPLRDWSNTFTIGTSWGYRTFFVQSPELDASRGKRRVVELCMFDYVSPIVME